MRLWPDWYYDDPPEEVNIGHGSTITEYAKDEESPKPVGFVKPEEKKSKRRFGF